MEGSGGSNSTVCDIYDGKDYAYVAMASAVAAFFSLLAACFVIIVMVFLRKWPFFSQRLILYLAIATILTSMSTILHRVDYNNEKSDFYVIFCQIGGFLEQVTSWIFLNANSCITFYLFANVVLRVKTERFEVIYGLYIFVFPFLFNWIPFIYSAFGRSGAWCWIRSRDSPTCDDFAFGKILIFALWFIPLYLTLFTLLVAYAIIIYKLHQISKEWTGKTTNSNEEFQKMVRKDVLPLMAYPLIYLVLCIFPTANRIQGLASPESPSLVLWYLSALSFPFQGGIIAVAYTFDPGTRRRLMWSHVRAVLGGLMEKSRTPHEYPVEYVTDASFSSVYRQSGCNKIV